MAVRGGFGRRLSAFLLLIAAAGAVAPATGLAQALDEAEALQASQAAIGRQVGNHRFIDQRGQPFELAKLSGRPILVSYIYTSCPFICPTLTTSLARMVRIARDTLGTDSFSVVTVGFDTRVDTPEQMRRYAQERRIDDPHWYFLSGDEATVAALAEEIGFLYVPMAGGYDHLNQVTVINAAGRVYQQVYGAEFQPPMIVDPLKRLALGSAVSASPVADLMSRVRLI
ncbi:MAG: SCO family protein, partial [Gammaproteobacteria bacterium]|nr:SCO family protein [Gammaproteobacteria bacterium]